MDITANNIVVYFLLITNKKKMENYHYYKMQRKCLKLLNKHVLFNISSISKKKKYKQIIYKN